MTFPALPTGIASASGGPPELLADLEGGRLLPLDPIRVDGVDQLDRVALGQLADDPERVVEVAADRDHARAVHQRLGELADRDLALGDDHGPAQSGPGRVGGGACGRVAGRRADHGLGAVLDGARDGNGHPAVLERAGRVGALDLQIHPGADALRDQRSGKQGRAALVERDDRVVLADRQVLAVFLDQAAHEYSFSITLIARGGAPRKSSSEIDSRAA